MIFKRKEKSSSPPKVAERIVSIKNNFKRYLTDELESVLNGWNTGDSSIDSTITRYHKKMVMRAREQHRKNDYVRRFFQLLETNVIGCDGIIMHALLVDEDGKRLTAKNKSLEKAWLKWQKKNHCDIAGGLDFVQMQQVILKTVAQDGEALIHIVKDKSNPFGLSLQLLDAQRLDVDFNKKLKNKNNIRHGIEFNQYGKPLAYHLLESDETGLLHQKKYQRIDAAQIIHLFRTEFSGQKRGMPWVSTALFRMKMLDSYQDAAIINANASAKKIAFFKKQFNDAADISDTPIFQDEHIGYGVIPSGYDLTSFDSQYPNGEIEIFTKSILRGVASGLGVSYNSLASDLEGVNFSSLRHGAIEERDNYRTIQNWFINSFLMPLYEKWLDSALLCSAIAELAPEDFEQCQNVRFQGRRWQWVDPAKEMTAFEKKLKMGVTTRADIIRESGNDPDHVMNQLKHENELLEEFGLSYLLHEQHPTLAQEQVDEKQN